MGIVVQFHAPMALLKPNILRSASLPDRESSSESMIKYSEGMAPLAIQFDTAETPTPDISATALLPPSSLINAFAEAIIPHTNSEKVNVSSLYANLAHSMNALFIFFELGLDTFTFSE